METSPKVPELPRAELCHAVDGRARLRFPKEAANQPFFERVGAALLEHPDVDEVRITARTASLLLLHHGQLSSILAHAAEAELFCVAKPVPHTPMRRVEIAIAELDDRLARESNGAFSLGTATFVGLLAAGIYQVRAGKLFPAGMTLFNYALDVMLREASKEKVLREGVGSVAGS